MKILFVRHAEAVDEYDFPGDDLGRPLTRKGERSARAAFKALARHIAKPDLIISSEAVRAKETAAILAKRCGIQRKKTSSALNPGCKMVDFRKIVSSLPEKTRYVAIVGHEPDISGIVSAIVAQGNLDILVKKGTCIEVEMDEECRGVLRFAVSPELLAGK